MGPLRNPVTGDPNDVRIVKPGGFVWKDGAVAQGVHLSIDVPGISFEHAGRHAGRRRVRLVGGVATRSKVAAPDAACRFYSLSV